MGEFQNHMMQMQMQQQQQQFSKPRKPHHKGRDGFKERDAQELCGFLNSLDLMDYAHDLIKEKIDVATLFELTAKDLEYFFPQVGPRRRLQAGLKRRAKDALKLQSEMARMRGKEKRETNKVVERKVSNTAKLSVAPSPSPPAMADAENLAVDMASSLFDD